MNEIILDVCRGNKIHPNDFFSQLRDPKLSRARRIAIHRLQQAGFSTRNISRIMCRSYSTVQYWIYPQYRKRRAEYARRYRAAHKASA